MATTSSIYRLALLLLLLSHTHAAWSDWSSSGQDESKYSQTGVTNWLNDYQGMSLTVHGCVWGQVNNLDDFYCHEKGSDDGLTSWYQMVNCKRAQVAYSVYASEGSSSVSCSTNSFMETLVTMNGLSGFVGTLESYDSNGYITSDDLEDLPVCDYDDSGYYLAVGCSASGDFTIDKFTDQYCLDYYDTYKTLSSITSALQKYKCIDCYGGLCYNTVTQSDSCSPNDAQVCEDITGKKTARYKSVSSYTGSATTSTSLSSGLSFASKIKYTVGSALLLSSFVMFLGILSTNRRKRRAAIQRKFRQSSAGRGDPKDPNDEEIEKDSKRHRSRSKSRHGSSHHRSSSKHRTSRKDRDGGESRKRSKSRSKRHRSKSRGRREKRPEDTDDGDGIWA